MKIRAVLHFGSATIVAGCLVLACGAPSPPEEETTVARVTESLGTCDPAKSCCATTFDLTDPFQAQLSAWSCTKPMVLSPNYANGKWWFWSRCLDTSSRVESFLAAHPTYALAPYSARATRDMTNLH